MAITSQAQRPFLPSSRLRPTCRNDRARAPRRNAPSPAPGTACSIRLLCLLRRWPDPVIVVAKCIERRKPWIAVTVEEDQFAAIAREGVTDWSMPAPRADRRHGVLPCRHRSRWQWDMGQRCPFAPSPTVPAQSQLRRFLHHRETPGYTWVPYEFFGPANAFLIAAIFSGAMHASLLPDLQARTAGSKSQPRGSKIIPSATPSLASHCFHQRIHEELAIVLRKEIFRFAACRMRL